MKRVKRLLRWMAGIALAGLSGHALANGNVHVSRHWHLHQPLYWPEWNTLDGQNNRVQTAWDSIQIKAGGGNMYPGSGVVHPQNVLVQGDPGEYDAVFTPGDRIAAYQDGPKNSLSKLAGADAGYSMSFSGSLIENVGSLGRRQAYGYGANWNTHNTTARGWTTSGGRTRMDLVNFTYHHAFGPLIPKSVLRKEIQIFRELWWKTWGGNPNKSDQSKGFWPSEAAFSPDMVDVLADEGIEWTIVANSHLSRTCQNFDSVAGLGNTTSNIDPPNRADRLGPTVPAGQWWTGSQDGRGAWQAAPFAYQAHKVRYVNPETGAEKKLTIVPMDDVMSYLIGYSPMGRGLIDTKVSPYATDPARPSIVLLSTDGENAWGGGFTSWQEATPDLLNSCSGAGYDVTTIQEFLADHPVPDAAIVHIEDGAWFNAANDWGHPQFVNWLYPPVTTNTALQQNLATRYDFETPGWSEDFRNWAVLIAGANYVETAEQLWKAQNGTNSIQAWRIQEPYQANGTYNNPNLVELAWHIFLAGFDSGFMYYGVSTDDEVKQTLAANRAIEKVAGFIQSNLAQDQTPPSVFKPQRFPWNPGGRGWGPLTLYRPVGFNGQPPWPSDFHVWTQVYDVSGVTSVVLKVRADADGTNALASLQNETFAGGAEVGPWRSLPMSGRALPTGNVTANGQINFFLTPTAMATYYFAKVTGYRHQLLDYYVEARDGRGNVHRSDIQHVFVEDDGTPGSAQAPEVGFSSDPRDCAPLTVTYRANGGALSNAVPVQVQISFDGGATFALHAMAHEGGGTSTYTVVTVPDNAPSAVAWFQNAAGTIFDSNGGLNFATPIRDCDAPSGPGSAACSNAPACEAVTLSYQPNAGVLQTATQVFAHVGFNSWAQVFPLQAMARISSNLWRFSIIPPPAVTQLDVAFHNGSNTWDNNSGQDWQFALNPCLPAALPDGVVITNPPLESLVVGDDVATYTLRGTAGTNLTGPLSWTNALAGAGGVLARSAAWEVTGVPLAIGTNVITVSGTVPGGPQELATDSATLAVYNPGWQSGQNGGSGWADGWTLSALPSDPTRAGHFRASTQSNLSVGPVAWGLYSNSGGLADAVRTLASPLSTGDVLSVRFDNNWIDAGGSMGIGLQNEAGANLFEFFFLGGSNVFHINDTTNQRITGVAYTDAGLELTFQPTGSDTYRFTAGTSAMEGQLAPAADRRIRRFRAFTFNAGFSTERNLYFNDLRIVRTNGPAAASGDCISLIRPGPRDHDGIPLAWWDRYGLGTNHLATGDADGDAANNWEEYIADTNPTNSFSSFTNVIRSMSGTGIQLLEVGGVTTNSRLYDVWGATSLLDAVWIPLLLDKSGPDGGGPLVLSVTNEAASRFYRTGVKLP